MPLNNRALTLAICAMLAGCGGDGGRPQLAYLPAADAPSANTAFSASPPPQYRPDAAPPNSDVMAAAPPLSNGPSGTSDRDANRYDEVGYATWYGSELAGARTASGAVFDPNGFTAAHRTLPLGSYVEVTSLQNGRTILVLVNDRGPQQTNLLIDLSQAAAKALGIQGRGAVRVRRINATPADVAAIRSRQPGTPRLDAPPGLLDALRQRLGTPAPGVPAVRIPGRPPFRPATPQPQVAKPAVKSAPVSGKATVTPGGYYVQVAAFSSQQRAVALAKSLGGSTMSSGALWRVRLGPFGSQNQAAQARDAAAARGYGDARVVRED